MGAVNFRGGNMNNSKYIQFGCGHCAPAEWRNFDSSATLRFEKLPVAGKLYSKNENRFPANVEYGDVVKGLPVAPNSCQGIYCSHVLEHLALDEFRIALRNVFNLLQPGGTFRFVLPDLEYYIQQYNQDSSPDAALKFMEAAHLGMEKRPKGLVSVLYEWLRTSAHLSMWDYKAMEAELKQAGFVDIRRAAFNDSSDEMFKIVEADNRWLNCLGVECRRPA
jgi:SAM-dependent methyltransferase